MLQGVRVCLNRSVKRAMARDKVKRDVVELTEVPAGRPGRPSKSLTPEQADGVLSWWTVALGGIMIMRPLGGRIRLRWSSGRRSVRTLAGVLSECWNAGVRGGSNNSPAMDMGHQAGRDAVAAFEKANPEPRLSSRILAGCSRGLVGLK